MSGQAVDAALLLNGGGLLEAAFWNGEEWGYVPLHHAMTGNPSIAINRDTGEQVVFFNGDGSLEDDYWNGTGWELVALHHAISGNPVAVGRVFWNCGAQR